MLSSSATESAAFADIEWADSSHEPPPRSFQAPTDRPVGMNIALLGLSQAPVATGGNTLRQRIRTPRSHPLGTVTHAPAHSDELAQPEGVFVTTAQLQEMHAFFIESHAISRSQVTNYKLGATHYRQFFRLAKPIVGSALAVAGLAAATYFVLTRAMLSSPAKALQNLSGSLASNLTSAIDELARSMRQPLSEGVQSTLREQLLDKLNATMQAMTEQLETPLLSEVTRTLANGSVPSAQQVAAWHTVFVEPLLRQVNDTVREVAEPLLGTGGRLAQAVAPAVDAALKSAVDASQPTSLTSQVLASVRNVLYEGAKAGVATVTFTTYDFAKMSMVSGWFYGVLDHPKALIKAFQMSEMHEMRMLQQKFHRLLADENTLEILLASPAEYKKEAKKLIALLHAAWRDLDRLEAGANIKIDNAHVSEVFRWLDDLIIHRPTEKMPVALWATKETRKQYIINVSQDVNSFPEENRSAVMFGFLGIASRSVMKRGVGGPLYIDARGEAGTGKSRLARLFRKHTGLPGSKVVFPPRQMGEGGPADLLSKTWDAATQTKFKTSDLQLLGLLNQQRLTTGRGMERYPNGVLNHISEFEEMPWDDPELHQIAKPLYDSESPYWPLSALRVHAWLGDGIFVSSSNKRNYTGPVPKNSEDDGAISSRMHQTIYMNRVLPEVRVADARRYHEKAVHLYSTPFEIDGVAYPAVLDGAQLARLRRDFGKLESDLCDLHSQAFSGLRVHYAAVLTESLAGNLMIEDMFSPAEREQYGLQLRTLDDFRADMRVHYEPYIQRRRDRLGIASTASGRESLGVAG